MKDNVFFTNLIGRHQLTSERNLMGNVSASDTRENSHGAGVSQQQNKFTALVQPRPRARYESQAAMPEVGEFARNSIDDFYLDSDINSFDTRHDLTHVQVKDAQHNLNPNTIQAIEQKTNVNTTVQNSVRSALPTAEFNLGRIQQEIDYVLGNLSQPNRDQTLNRSAEKANNTQWLLNKFSVADGINHVNPQVMPVDSLNINGKLNAQISELVESVSFGKTSRKVNENDIKQHLENGSAGILEPGRVARKSSSDADKGNLPKQNLAQRNDRDAFGNPSKATNFEQGFATPVESQQQKNASQFDHRKQDNLRSKSGGQLAIPPWLSQLQTDIRQRARVPVADHIVNVSIGRIEVRAMPAETKNITKAATKPMGVMSLDEYLKQRELGGKV